MMRHHRILALVTAVILLTACLCACGETPPQSTATTTTSTAITTTTADTTALEQGDTTTVQQETTTSKNETTATQEKTTIKEKTTTTKEKTTTTAQTATTTSKTEITTTKATTTTTTTVQTTVATTTTTKAPVKTALIPLAPYDYYGYTLLKREADGEVLTKLYEHFVAQAEKMETAIELESISSSLTLPQVKKVWNYYQLDYPQHFWVDNGFNYTTRDDVVVELQPFYSMTVAERDKAKPEFDAVVKSMLSDISGSWKEYDRELAVHDALCNRVTYKDNGKTSHNAYGALVNKTAVCEGYAEAFQYLMYQCGIQCLGVFGTAQSEQHKWNIVYVDGVYYDVDVTWDDPVVEQDAAALVAHTYFNLSDAILFRDHDATDDRNYPLPHCESMEENYYTMQGVWLHDFSEEAIAKAIQKHGETVEIYLDKHTTSEFSAWLKEHWKSIRDMAGGEYQGYRMASIGDSVMLTLTK